MAQGDKSAIYQALKRAGHEFDKHYREYTTEELAQIAGERGLEVDLPEPASPVPPRPDEVAELRKQIDQLTGVVTKLAGMVSPEQRREEHEAKPTVRTAAKPMATTLDPAEHAGVTQNSHQMGDVVRVDEHGNKWFQIEVPKPAFPKPRGRRVLKYEDPGVTKERIKVGEYVEEFEVAGDPKNARPSEIKITLPSYQTGIYLPPNMPFRVHTYNGVRGFNLFDVQKFYGGSDLVPQSIKRVYVSNDLCYDITTTIRTIENEYRERVLKAEKGLSA